MNKVASRKLLRSLPSFRGNRHALSAQTFTTLVKFHGANGANPGAGQFTQDRVHGAARTLSSAVDFGVEWWCAGS
jgi:hypothetical protein